MAASIDGGLIPPENVVGGQSIKEWGGDGLRELTEDCAQDAISEIEMLVGSSEVGVPRSYIEEERGGRTFRDVYVTYPYVVLGMDDGERIKQCFSLMIEDVRKEVDRYVSLGFAKEHLIVVWRFTEKIVSKHEWCRRCGGSSLIRTRLLVKPDRDFYFGPGLDRDPALGGL